MWPCSKSSMPSPSPQLIETLVARVGEPEAIRWLDLWSTALLEGRKPPRLPRRTRPPQSPAQA